MTQSRTPSIIIFLIALAVSALVHLNLKSQIVTSAEDTTLTFIVSLTGNPHIVLPTTESENTKSIVEILSPEEPVFQNIQITDDPKHIFESSPPSPIDIALILSIMRKAGVASAGLVYPLAWDDLDPISTGVLELELQKMSPTSLGVPLTRSATADIIPRAILQSSLAVDTQNAPHSVPVVNRIPTPPATYGAQDSLIGFTQLESELSEPGAPHLLARWDDRLVLSSLVTALMASQKLSIDQAIVSPSHISFGPHSFLIPIDEFGRLEAQTAEQTPPHPIPADEFVSPSSSDSPTLTPNHFTLITSASLTESAHFHSLLSSPRTGKLHILDGLSPAIPLTLSGAFAALLCLFCTRKLVRVTTATVLIIASFGLSLAVARQGFWLPTSPMITAVTVAIGGLIFLRTQSAGSNGEEKASTTQK